MKNFVTNSAEQSKKLGEILSQELKGGEIIALSGDLGSGKTTFTQGLLKELGVRGPVTSPTFAIIKKYKVSSIMYKVREKEYLIHDTKYMIQNIYHIDAYRVKTKDILNLGWKEIIDDKNSIIIIEWADKIRKIIPRRAIQAKFKWIGKNEREITFEIK